MSRRGAIGMIGGAAAADLRRSARREAPPAGGAAVRRRCRRQPEPKFSVAERMATVWSADRAVQSAGRAKVGLRTPAALYATAYRDAAVTKIHRPYETLLGLSRRLDIPIQWAALLGPERAFADAVLSSGAEVVLVCYEHVRIPALVAGFPTVDGTAIPSVWPDDRFDVIWTVTLNPAGGNYVVSQG